MSIIKVYDTQGFLIDIFLITPTLTYIGGRISKGEDGLFYKGSGLFYKYHYAKDPSGCKIITEMRDSFFRYRVINPKYEGKNGIFLDTFFPIFSEYMGSCGIRESDIIPHSVEFGRSDVEVIDYIKIGTYNDVECGFYKIHYRSGRCSFLESGCSKVLVDLIDYMVKEGWNFPWDKECISDISCNGTITDVADLYKSFSFQSKIGTVFCILDRLAQKSIEKYINLINYMNIRRGYSFNIPIVAMYLLYTLGVDSYNLIGCNNREELPLKVKECLVSGRNCHYGEYEEYGKT
jgi:hypothetical protein